MKRDSRGKPAIMVHRWGRPPLSCRPCREKKRRCDRNRPCSNCTQRQVQCEYGQQNQGDELSEGQGSTPQDTNTFSRNVAATIPSAGTGMAAAEPSSFTVNDVLRRLRRLEDAVFDDPSQATRIPAAERPDACGTRSDSHPRSTPLSAHVHTDSQYEESSPDTKDLGRHLPPIGQARDLFTHFAAAVQPNIGVLHIPSTRHIVEQTYQGMSESEGPDTANLLLLFSIFTAATLAWTPQLLGKLDVTQTEMEVASMAYMRLALSIIRNPGLLTPSTTAFAAMRTLAHPVLNSDSFRAEFNLIHFRCATMAREMQIHCLDAAKSRDERRLKGCNAVEIEVQRRAWWSMVATDWLSAFLGQQYDGVYYFQPQQMVVNYPSNVDDEFVTPTEVLYDWPLTQPTSMTAFIHRVKLASLCREIVDTLPSTFLASQEPEYDDIMRLDGKFQQYINELPVFFRLDQDSINQSQEICKERPHIAWQRISIHFSLHSRLFRLHRPYHLEGMANAKYAYSRKTCIRSAQTVLELRRAMDDAGAQVGMNPARIWMIVQHFFSAVLLLATDVSFDPNAADAEARKAKVLAAYQTLEKTQEESKALVESIQRNMQTIMSTLQKQRSPISRSRPYTIQNEVPSIGLNSETFHRPAMADGDGIAGKPTSFGVDSEASNLTSEIGTETNNWDQLWSNFVAAVPELDTSQWTSLLDDMEFDFDLNI